MLYISFRLLAPWLIIVGAFVVDGRQFNLEVEKRIRERLDFFLAGPVDTGRVLAGFRRNGGFPNNMDAADRDQFLALAYSVNQPLVYFGLEDGTCPGYYWSSGYYREPGNAGYAIDNPDMQKHLNSCVDAETGAPVQCLLNPGTSYIACKGGEGDEGGLCPQIEPCPNQPACPVDVEQCNASVKWCRQYSIAQAPSNLESTGLGFIPITNFCHNDKGHFTQEPGTVVDPLGDDRDTEERISCRFADGSLVQRNLSGDYAACGGDGSTCDTVFNGGYSSSEYDPRYRPWYMNTRELQKPNWTPPSPFFTLGLGITYAEPFYTTDAATGREIFAGVIAVDYRFEDVANFLVESYGKTDTAVIVFEVDEPNYVIASSSGSPSSRSMRSDDLSQPCPVDRGEGTGCEPVRITINEFGDGRPMDTVLVKAAARHADQGFPQELLSVKVSADPSLPLYVSQSTVFSQEGAELSWRVVVVEPAAESTSDYLLPGDSLFSVICAVAGLGCIICAMFVFAIYRRRHEKAIVFADWRFTSAFIFGCFLFNASSFALLGKNTDATCLLRMWTFHLCFVIALSPLFIKVWRMYKLVGSVQVRRNTITNLQAALYTLPMILTQAILLLVFTFVDPPQPMDYVEQNDGDIVYGVVCGTDTNAAVITLGVYEFSFVFAGCVLAYMTRNMQDEFGEAKQMIFSMYNIFFVGLIVVILVQFIGLEGNEQSILQAVGVFWGTVFSAGAFVIPRLLQVREVRRDRREGRNTSNNVHVSGLGTNSTQYARDGTGPRNSSNAGTTSDLDVIEEDEMEDYSSTDLMAFAPPNGSDDETLQAQQSSTEQAPIAQSSLPSSSRVNRINFAGEIASDDSS